MSLSVRVYQFIYTFIGRLCTGNCDINLGFILDASGSLKNDYGNAQMFLKLLSRTIGSPGSVVSFSFDAVHNIRFNDFIDQSTFERSVDAIPFIGSTTRIDEALRLAQSEMFLERNGGVLGKARWLIILTDGSHTEKDSDDPVNIAKELRSDGINILAVAVGAHINREKLAAIVGSNSNVYEPFPANLIIHESFVNQVKVGVCNNACQPQPRTQPEPRSEKFFIFYL